VLLPGCRDTEAARLIAEDLRARLNTPCKLPDGVFQLDASIGIACFPADGNDPDTLVAHADRAMYVAKRQPPQRE
jgi:GGDEF domain-containing protein